MRSAKGRPVRSARGEGEGGNGGELFATSRFCSWDLLLRERLDFEARGRGVRGGLLLLLLLVFWLVLILVNWIGKLARRVVGFRWVSSQGKA